MENKDNFKNVAKKFFYTGLGAVSVAAEFTGKIVDNLAQKGAEIAADNQFINDSKNTFREIKCTLKDEADIIKTLSHMTKEEREQLLRKVKEDSENCDDCENDIDICKDNNASKASINSTEQNKDEEQDKKED